jgi:hypothetical protein
VTIIEHIIASPHRPTTGALTGVRVRWACVARACAAAVGAPAAPPLAPDGCVTLAAHLLDGETAEIECWIECAGERVTVLAPQRARCVSAESGGCRHIDIRLGARRILAMTIDAASARVLYCQSDLLAEMGLPGGACDAPRCELITTPN